MSLGLDPASGLDLTPEQRARLAQAVQDAQSAYPDPAAVPEQDYQQTGLQRVFEGFAGMEDQRQQAPRGFLEGAVGGLQRGLGAAGSRIANERAKFEEQAAKRRANQDALRIEATRNRSQMVAGELSGIRKDTRSETADAAKDARTATADQAKYDRDNPKPGTIEYRASLQKLTDEERARSAGKPRESSQAREPIVAIEGPNGPVYVRQSEALGKSPARTTRTNQPVKGADRQALAYYNRGKQAIETLATPDAKGKTLEQRVSANLGGQIGLQFAPDWLKTPDARAYRQAQRAFTEARLRKESGAAIPPHEYEADAKTYFVQPGDDPASIEQKRLSRDVVLQGLAYGAGPAFEEFYGEKFSPTASTGAPAPASAPKPGGWFATNKRKVAR